MKPSPIADAYVAPGDAKGQPSFPLDLYLCRACGHVQLLDVVDPSTLFGDYIYRTSKSPSLVEHFRGYASNLVDRIPPPPSGLAIDIGSNDGTFLGFLKAKGLRVLGIDPATHIAAEATEAGIETRASFFTSSLAREIRSDRGPACYVTANNVFAHSDSLPDMADGIRELLEPEGVFVFEVSYLVDIIEKLLFDTIYHEHLSYHSIAPLNSFFARHGLELFDITRLPSKGGSLQGWVQRRGGRRPRAPIVGELLALEEKMGLAKPAIFREFSDKIAKAKSGLHEVLGRIDASQTVTGYGASATVTTLIHNLEIGPFLSYLVDDDPRRHGLLSPGLHIPVWESRALYERKPEFAVILAWQYADPIVKKNRAYLEQGGHFILPLPTAQVL